MSTFAIANLPPVTSLATSLRALEQDVGAVGSVIIKMDKTGHWVFGADQTEAEDGAKWAVNPFSFVHGSIAWGDGEVLAERMVSVAEPLPELDAAPPGAKRGTRQWANEDDAIKFLGDKAFESKLISVAQAEKLVGKKNFPQELAVSVSSGNTLANEDDPRPAILNLSKVLSKLKVI